MNFVKKHFLNPNNNPTPYFCTAILDHFVTQKDHDIWRWKSKSGLGTDTQIWRS